MRKLSFHLILAFVLLGCGNSPSNNNNQEVSRSPIAVSFTVRDKFEQESHIFTVGEEIAFVFDIENTSDESFSYQDTAPSLSVQVSRESESVWYSHYGISFTQVLQEFTIPARQNTQSAYEWNGKNNEGALLPPGKYFVEPVVDIPINSDISNIPERLLIELRS